MRYDIFKAVPMEVREAERRNPQSAKFRVLIVAEHASTRFGGEAILPLHYFRSFRRRGIDVWLLVHSRTRAELSASLPGEDLERIIFVRDTWLHVVLDLLAKAVPSRLAEFAFRVPLQLLTQVQQRAITRRLVRDKGVSIIHQPIPVSPKWPSAIFRLGPPVVMGPLNGGMRDVRRPTELRISRAVADLVNRLIPGKIEADAVLVANERTRRALPSGVRGVIHEVVENGVDLSLWTPDPVHEARSDGPFRVVYVGRLVDWKCVDLLLDAFKPVVQVLPATLTIVGDGPERRDLERKALRLGLHNAVAFTGWLSQEACAAHIREAHALVLPSMRESGGAVVLEAMALGVPVIATNWGGPADYLDGESGILVDPVPISSFVGGLTQAMLKLGREEDVRLKMGRNARRRVIERFDWEKKVEMVLGVYRDVLDRSAQVVG